jgi:copper oxidase (laccase) domain-containing protein
MDSLLPDGFEEGPRDASLSLTLRYNATVKTEVDALAAQTAVVEKQIRLKQTSGTKIAQFDFAGIIAKPPATFEDADGVLTSKLDFTSKYNTALANCFAASISNSVASLV